MDDIFGTYNKLGNSRFYRFEGVEGLTYSVELSRVSGGSYPPEEIAGDPDFFVYFEDSFINEGISADNNRERGSFTAAKTGEYRIVLSEYLISQDVRPRDNTYCYSTTIRLEN
jgi:hypothetical protein